MVLSGSHTRPLAALLVAAALFTAACSELSDLPTPTTTPKPTPAFAVTAVSAAVVPTKGSCDGPFIFSGMITANGAGEVTYRWVRDDGTGDPAPPAASTLTFPSAGILITASHTWVTISPAGARSARIQVLTPNPVVSSAVTFTCTP